MRGHHDRPEAQQAGLVDRLARATGPASRSASSAKSIIMIAFFFTMPMSRMMPMSAMTLNSVPAQHQREERADAGRRQRRQDRDRVDVALVEHAEHDVDGDQRRQDQERLAGQRLAEGLRRALEVARARRAAGRARRSRAAIASTASPSDDAGREVERERHRRELPLVVDRRAARALRSKCANADERHRRRRSASARRAASSASGSCWNSGFTSRITRYRLSWVKMVETCAGRRRRRACRRWPAA